MRRRISEAGVFELIKRKFPDDLWKENTCDSEDEPSTWSLVIETSNATHENAYQVLRYADKTLYAMAVNEDDESKGNQRPTPKQLEQLFEYVMNL